MIRAMSVSPSSAAQRQQGRHISEKNREQQLTCIIHFFHFQPIYSLIEQSNETKSNVKMKEKKKQWKKWAKWKSTWHAQSLLRSPLTCVTIYLRSWLCASSHIIIAERHSIDESIFAFWLQNRSWKIMRFIGSSNAQTKSVLNGLRSFLRCSMSFFIKLTSIMSVHTQTKCRNRDNEYNFIRKCAYSR